MAVLLIASFFASCKDEPAPLPTHPIEKITSLKLTVQEYSWIDGSPTGSPWVITYSDPDGSGGNDPVISSGFNIDPIQLYEFKVEFLDESVSPAKDITSEIISEGTEHQVFYYFTGSDGLVTEYIDFDTDGKPIGTHVKPSIQNVNTGNLLELKIILKHMPDKDATGVSSGDITNSAGETDFETTPGITVTIVT